MDIYGPFHTNWDCFYSPKTEQVGCPRAAHSSYIGSSWWNRIPWLFPVSYIPTYNLMLNFQHNQPNQFLDCHGQSKKSKKKFHNSVPCFGTDHTAHSRPFSYQACILMQNFHTNSPQISGQSRPLKKISKKFQQFGPKFWDRSNGPSRPQTNRNIKKHLNKV